VLTEAQQRAIESIRRQLDREFGSPDQHERTASGGGNSRRGGVGLLIGVLVALGVAGALVAGVHLHGENSSEGLAPAAPSVRYPAPAVRSADGAIGSGAIPVAPGVSLNTERSTPHEARALPRRVQRQPARKPPFSWEIKPPLPRITEAP